MEAAGTEMQEGIGAGVMTYMAPVAMALGPAAILGGPGHVDDIEDQVISEALASLCAGGVVCGAPEDDTGHAQGCAVTNGGDKIHLPKPREPVAVVDLIFSGCHVGTR